MTTMNLTKTRKRTTLKTYVIDWTIGGTYTVQASSPEEAQEKFDLACEGGGGKGINPLRDGEWQNDPPQEMKP